MTETITYQLWPRPFGDPEPFVKLQAFLEGRGFVPEDGGFTQFVVQLNRHRSIGCETLREFLDVLRSYKNPTFVRAVIGFTDNPEKKHSYPLRVTLCFSDEEVWISVSNSDVDRVKTVTSFIETAFQLGNLPEPANSLPSSVQATALIGCHFDEVGLSAAKRVARFLELLRFARAEVLDAQSGKSIPEKVRAGIERNDIYLGIVTPASSHDWITSELSYALARGKTIIVLVQKDAGYKPTIEGGDRERIEFEGSIDAAMLPLLEAIRALNVIGL